MKAGEVLVPHPLICHVIDTAAVAEVLSPRLLGAGCRAQLSAAFAPLGGDFLAWVAFFCGLHDLGKLSPAFQALRADVAIRLLPDAAAIERLHRVRAQTGGTRTDTPHGILTAYLLRRLLTDWGAPVETALMLGQALGGHHGNFFPARAVRNAALAMPDNGGEEYVRRAEALACRTAELLGLPDPRTVRWAEVKELGTGAAVALAGLATVSDWIASGSVGKATYAGADVDLEPYVDLARDRARVHVDRLGWSPWSPPRDVTYEGLFGERPRPLQSRVEEMIASRTQPGILVVEAPTGEGKTKLALHSVVRLASQLGLAGFFMAMPTRATSNQAFEEVDKLLQSLDGSLSAKLLHGTAAEYLDERQARAEPSLPENVGEDEPGGVQDQAVREWFTRRRGLLAPFAVGTIDRILQAGIRWRWAPVPLVGLSNRVLVLDEVHSYDVYMSTLLDRVLWWLGWFEVPVILLSATLPSARRDELVRWWYAGVRHCRPTEVDLVLPSGGYPRALWLDTTGAAELVEAEPSKINADRRIALTRLADQELVEWALRHAAQGWGVAVIHNIHSRIRATMAALRAAVAALPEGTRPRIVEITGRLTQARRAAVERELRGVFGRDGSRAPAAGFIVVGTQVLEQSLDLDFDIMASDPAPIDSLIQRAGRLHRFRPVDGRTPPTLAIVGVTEQKSGPKWPAYTTNVYEDLVLLRTWSVLRERTELRFPDEVPGLVDAVYSTDSETDGWSARWEKATATMRRARAADERQARELFLPPPDLEDALVKLTQHPRNASQTRKPDRRGRRDD